MRCPLCGKKLTSYFAKGKYKKGHFGYYACPERKKHSYLAIPQKFPDGETIEDKFCGLLKKVKPTPQFMDFFAELLEEKYNQRFFQLRLTSKTIDRDISELSETIKTLKYKHLKGIYDDAEYIEIKDDLESQIAIKKGIKSEMNLEALDIKTILNFMKYYLTNMDIIFSKANIEDKYKLGCSIFPEGVLFEKDAYRTPLLGHAYALTNQFASTLSNCVPSEGLEPPV